MGLSTVAQGGVHILRLLQGLVVGLLELGSDQPILRLEHTRHLLRLVNLECTDFLSLLVYVLLNSHVCVFYFSEHVLKVK